MKLLILTILLLPVWYAILQTILVLVSDKIPFGVPKTPRLELVGSLLTEDEKYLIIRAVQDRVIRLEELSIAGKADYHNVREDVDAYNAIHSAITTNLWK